MQRDPRLRGLSSDHHHALVIARRLSHGEKGWGDADGRWLDERFRQELEPHFQVEEEVLLPALSEAGRGDLARRTADDHAAIRALAERARCGDAAAAQSLGEHLTQHVRFEERTLFPACEAELPGHVLDEVARRAPKQA